MHKKLAPKLGQPPSIGKTGRLCHWRTGLYFSVRALKCWSFLQIRRQKICLLSSPVQLPTY